MKKNKVVLLVLIFSILFCYLISLSFTKENKYKFYSNFSNDIGGFFGEQDEEYIKSLNLEEIKVHFSDSVSLHFQSIYSELQKGNIDAYRVRNNWKKGEVAVQGVKYPVLIKSHGKEPDSHKIGAHISLSIKSEIPIHGYKKFKLIIYERITVNSDRIKILSSQFNLVCQEGKLVSVTINDEESKLYFFEIPLKKEFLGKKGLINFELEYQKSPILNQLNTYNELIFDLQKEIFKTKLSDSTKLKIFQSYVQLNLYIKAGNIEEISEFFDLEYISNFQAARMLGGFVNHGFSPENLIFALDTNNYKFYPILHRDNYFGLLDLEKMNSWEPYYYPGVEEFEFKVLELITNNSTIRRNVNIILQNTLEDKNELVLSFDEIDKHHKALFNSWVDESTIDEHLLQKNFETLKHYLYESSN